MNTFLVLTLLSVSLALNAWATTVVVADSLISRQQKTGQLALIWLLPMIGSILVLAVHRKEQSPSRRYAGDKDPGEDFTYSGKSVKAITEALDGD